MARIRRKSGRRRKAPAIVMFDSRVNDRGHRQSCVFARCELSGTRVGPIWSHTTAAVKRALATLTKTCECPARYHRADEYHGTRLVSPGNGRKN